MSLRAIVVGEALVDRITDTVGHTRDVLGGGPYNAARTLARLGVPTGFLGGISSDAAGDAIAQALSECGVSLLLPQRSQNPTGIAHATLDQGGAATYTFDLEASACADVTPEAATAAVSGVDADVAHVGTLGLVLQPLADATQALVNALAPETLLFLDPNCRPAVIADRVAYLARIDRLLARADVVKVSGDDLEFLEPERPRMHAARDLQRRCGGVVLFTDGAEVVWALGPGWERGIPVPQVEVVDTVGAGDAFGAGFIAHWLRQGHGREHLTDGDEVADACARAVQVAAWTCRHVGAQVPALGDLPSL